MDVAAVINRILTFLESPAGQALIQAISKLIEHSPDVAAKLIDRFMPKPAA